jgi:mannose-1-phosphate guanylyltransferase/mannose-6-phosphate isomerase
MPKQFLPLIGKRSTYQQALERVSSGDLFAPPIVLTSEDFRFFSQQQAQELGIEASVVLEPMRRDSGPAIAAGSAIAHRRDPQAIVLAMAADHVILDPDAFLTACRSARDAAAAGYIVTFGICPSSPKTSYGYIHPGQSLGIDGVRSVAAFVEKPGAEAAARYIADGYLWNSGNFMFRAGVLLQELAQFQPSISQAVDVAVANAVTDLGFTRLDREAFARSPANSIDYAVMEKTERAAVVEGKFRWSDIGSWDSVLDITARDQQGNAVRGPVVTIDSANCVIHAEDRLTAVAGVKDLIVVTTKDAVLVLPRDRAEEVKKLVSAINELGRTETREHRRCYRPWGHYESVDMGERFQVKRIVVAQGGKLSLQQHMHRAEHWVVVRGTAQVTIGDSVRTVHENESVYVPIGSVHRLANPGRIPLELIEVQTGSYLGEDDIVRLGDVYQRT